MNSPPSDLGGFPLRQEPPKPDPFRPAQELEGDGFPLRQQIPREEQEDLKAGAETEEEEEAQPIESAIVFPLGQQRAADEDDSNRRFAGRLPLENVNCSLGKILDISAGGMRVRCKQPPERLVSVVIRVEDTNIELDAKIVWMRKVGFRKFDAGLKFLDVSDYQRQMLVRMSIQNRKRRSM